MPPYKRPVSRAQARFFGYAAGGNVPGFSAADAQNKLRGVDESKLPAHIRKKQAPMPAPALANAAAAKPVPPPKLSQQLEAIIGLNRLRNLQSRMRPNLDFQ